MRILPTLIMLLFTLLLSACGSSTQYFMIPITHKTPSTPIITTPQKSYAFRNLTLPDYLTDQFIIYYDTNGKINRSSNRRWADAPDDNIRRVIYHQLNQTITPASFYSYPLAQNIHADYLIDIQLHDMIGNHQSKIFYISADWQTSDYNHGKTATYHFEKTYPFLDTNTETLIQLYQQALTELTEKIARTLP